MKKFIIILVMLLILICPLFAEAELSYKPYEKDEFPIWTMKMSRATSLFFGSMVLTLPISSLIMSLIPIEGSSDLQKFGYSAALASGLSLIISTTDLIIGEVQGD